MSSYKPKFSKRLLHPKHWMMWFWFAIWRLVLLLPYSLLVYIGSGFGLLMHKLPTRRKQIAYKNIQMCFADLDENQHKTLLRANFISMGITLMETGMSWWWPTKRLQPLIKYRGLEHLHEHEGKPVIVLGIHHTTLEISAAALSIKTQVDGMYRAHKNPVYDFIQGRGRLNHGVKGCTIVERNDVRAAIKGLKGNRKLWYLPDHDYGLKQGLFAPLFGKQAATLYTTARLAAKTQATVLPVSCIRLAGSKGYEFTVYPPLKNFPVGDDLADATTVNKKIEEMICLKPEQYLWAHRRFKNRPKGEEDVYNFPKPG